MTAKTKAPPERRTRPRERARSAVWNARPPTPRRGRLGPDTLHPRELAGPRELVERTFLVLITDRLVLTHNLHDEKSSFPSDPLQCSRTAHMRLAVHDGGPPGRTGNGGRPKGPKRKAHAPRHVRRSQPKKDAKHIGARVHGQRRQTHREWCSEAGRHRHTCRRGGDGMDNARTIRMASPKIRASRPSTRQTTTVLAKAISKRRRRRETRKRIRTCTIPALYPACGAATPPVGPTGMMVTARVADSGLAQRRSPFKRAAGEENVGDKVPFRY